MGKFKSTTLRNKIHVKHGFSFKGEYFASEGKYIILTPGNFYESGGFKFDIEKAKFYNGEFPEEYICSKGDLVVAMTEQAEGLLGSSAIVPEDNRFLHNQRIGLVTVDKKEIDKSYLYHVFNTKSVRQQLRSSSSGSKVKHTSPDRIYDVIVNLPPLPTQQKIAAVLSALDAKIELNQRINAELESMAKTLYDYWFVQFEFDPHPSSPKWDKKTLNDSQTSPVPFGGGAREAGGGGRVGYKSAGGKMVWDEALKREIPLGWEVGELSDIANITMGQSPPGESYNEDAEGMIFFQGCTDFGNRFPSVRQFTTQPTRFAKAGDILLSVRAPVGTINIAKEDCCIGRGLAALNSKDNTITYLLEVMRNLKQVFDRRNVNGTTFGSITKDDLFSLKVLKPEKNILDQYQKIIYPTFEKQNKLELESQTLTELRDWLLPMLMNGQVTPTRPPPNGT